MFTASSSIGEWKLVTICMVVSASMSFLASSIMTIQIARSKTTGSDGVTKPTLFTSPYHRIIFGIGVSDIMQSFAIFSGPFAVPTYVSQALWAAGNGATCRLNGFVLSTGQNCTVMYTLFYCYFSTCKIVWGISDEDFIHKMEWKVHIFIFVSNMSFLTAVLLMNSFHSSVNGQLCTIGAEPAGCRQRPDLFGECDERSAKRAEYLWVIACFNVLTVLGAITTCMLRLCWHVLKRKNSITGSDQRSQQQRQNRTDAEEFYRRQVFIQASLYILVYFLVYFIPAVLVFLVVIAGLSPAHWINVSTSIFYPMGGCLNVMVFTRPGVLSLRRRNPHYSYLEAFIIVVRAGTAVPMVESQSYYQPGSSLTSVRSGSVQMNTSSSAGMNCKVTDPTDGSNQKVTVERVFYRFPIPPTPALRFNRQDDDSPEAQQSSCDEEELLSSLGGMQTILECAEEEMDEV